MRKGIYARIGAVMIACLLLPTAVVMAGDDWDYLYTRDGIDVFQKTIPETGAHAFKGLGFVDARLEVIGAVIRDIAAYPRWVARCRKAVVLQDIDFNTKIFYSIVDAPPPFQDRDMVIQNDTIYDLEKGTAEITFRLSDQALVPPTDNYYRVTELSGEYLLEYFGRDKTRITFEYRGCPGGNVPVKLADWIESRHYPYINIMGIRRMVREQKYIEAGAESPDRELIENAGSDPAQVAKIFKNRIGEYIVDPRVLDIVFDSRTMQEMVKSVHAEKTTFESIQQAVAGVFSELACRPAVAACIDDKPLQEIICLSTLMREKWLVDLIARNRQQIEGYLNTPGTNIEKLFYKIATSENAVRAFIKDDDLARAILSSESIRTRLWQESGFKKEVLDKILTFENVGDFEKIVAKWVGRKK
jgi:hypothetical protein